ncbi:MAG: hypothetical protein M0Z89_07910 [Nitrospiraceae bacterium]|nr:hypothetical protein [Nitrospiraceae bacterium]
MAYAIPRPAVKVGCTVAQARMYHGLKVVVEEAAETCPSTTTCA